MPNPGWNVHWSSELTGSDSNLFETTGWSPWRAPNTLYLTSSPLSGGRCKMYLENPPSGYSTVAAGGYTQDQNINPSSEFNGRGIYRNRWTAVMDFYPTERPFPRTKVDDAHAGVFLRVQPNRTWSGNPNQTRFGCFMNGKNTNPRAALQFTGDDASDPSLEGRKIFDIDLSEDPFSNPTEKYRVQIIEEEVLNPLSGVWKLRWGAEVWNRSDNPNTQIGELKWITEDDLAAANVAIPELSGSVFAMGLGPSQRPNAAGTVNVDFVGTAYWHF